METSPIRSIEKGVERSIVKESAQNTHMRAPPGEGLYLCCLFKGDSSLSPEIGIDGVTPTFTIRHLELGALVSPVPSTNL